MSFIRKSLITLAFMSLTILPSAEAAKELNISGVVEGEYSSTSEYGGGGKSSDIVAATANLTFEAKLSKGFSAVADFLFEEGDTPYDVESGYIVHEMGNFTMQAGRFFVPFGVFDTNMVSDPLTLEMGETSESALMFTYGAGPANFSVYAFNGDVGEVTNGNYVNNYGFNIGFEHDAGAMQVALNLGYINNIGDSDGLSAIDDDDDDTTNFANGITSLVAGYALSANFTMGDFGLVAEYIKAADTFDKDNLSTGATDGDGDPTAGATPTALNFEASYGFGDFTFAVGMQKTEDMKNAGLAESRTMFAVSRECTEGVAMTFEYMMEDDYGKDVNGTGKDKNTITVQMAAEF